MAIKILHEKAAASRMFSLYEALQALKESPNELAVRNEYIRAALYELECFALVTDLPTPSYIMEEDAGALKDLIALYDNKEESRMLSMMSTEQRELTLAYPEYGLPLDIGYVNGNIDIISVPRQSAEVINIFVAK